MTRQADACPKCWGSGNLINGMPAPYYAERFGANLLFDTTMCRACAGTGLTHEAIVAQDTARHLAGNARCMRCHDTGIEVQRQFTRHAMADGERYDEHALVRVVACRACCKLQDDQQAMALWQILHGA